MQSLTTPVTRLGSVRRLLLAGLLAVLLIAALGGASAQALEPPSDEKPAVWTAARNGGEACHCSYRVNLTQAMIDARKTWHFNAAASQPGKFYLRYQWIGAGFGQWTDIPIGDGVKVDEQLPAGSKAGHYTLRFKNDSPNPIQVKYWIPRVVAMR